MDMASVFQIVSITAFSLSGIFLIISVVLFIKLGIPEIIGDFSGRTAQKQIKVIRDQNVEKEEHRYRPDEANALRVKPNERPGNSNRLRRRNPTGDMSNSGKLVNEKALTGQMQIKADRKPEKYNMPDILKSKIILSAETELLVQSDPSAPTEVLAAYDSDSLSVTEKLAEQGRTTLPGAALYPFEVIKNVTLIHTEETI